MDIAEIIFWSCAALVLYTFAGYPLLLGVLAWLFPRRHRTAPFAGRVSVVVAAHNEENAIARRLEELTGQLRAAGVDGDVIVVSDGSTDGTVLIARGFTKDRVQVVDLPERVGKAAALNLAVAQAGGDVLVFADTRQVWAPDALRLLLENFADPQVGAVSGELMVQGAAGVLEGVSLYWRFEKWLRRCESAVHSTVGVTGAICAVRRELFHPIPAGTLLDDVYWPLRVALQNRRVVFDNRAQAFDRLPDRTRDEFRRKVRTLSGNFQLLGLLPQALLPVRSQVWLEFLSHKVLRLAAPWALLGLLASSLILQGPPYEVARGVQGFGYALALLGLLTPLGKRLRLVGAAASFLVLNAAAWLAFWVWVSGRAGRSWGKVNYRGAVPPTPAPQPAPAEGVGEPWPSGQGGPPAALPPPVGREQPRIPPLVLPLAAEAGARDLQSQP
jgi:cellulose synthase/poly-beta-1,6-N-acetylglucosamine synthase-like glycosyltransferase